MEMCFGRFADDYINLVEWNSSFFGVVEKLGEGSLIKGLTTIDEKGDFYGGFHFLRGAGERGVLEDYSILRRMVLFGFLGRGFGEEFGNGVVLGGIGISQSITIFDEHGQFNSEHIVRGFF